ncbi:hypothetical protein LZ554_000325 [Drepanopeziza brunnea f. sp. 'monogermtubi']|nr:hypothetical protein LZ554_000325 [Drepanopeziza brunnea f. sp. 'monogermtubi']
MAISKNPNPTTQPTSTLHPITYPGILKRRLSFGVITTTQNGHTTQEDRNQTLENWKRTKARLKLNGKGARATQTEVTNRIVREPVPLPVSHDPLGH